MSAWTREGLAAYRAGLPRDANPYGKGHARVRRRMWTSGWDMAEKAAQSPGNAPPAREDAETLHDTRSATERVLACLTGPRFVAHLKRERERSGDGLESCKRRLTKVAMAQAIEVAETPADFRLILARVLDQL